MVSKISSDMYPLSELRKEYTYRIRTTAFSKHPEIFVSFKLLSNLVPAFPEASELYAEVIEKALSGVTFQSSSGVHTLSQVEYMFVDDEGFNVAVLVDGCVTDILCPGDSSDPEHIQASCPLKFRVSTKQLKKYYVTHREKYPHLNYLTSILNSIGVGNYTSYSTINSLVSKLRSLNWVQHNIINCLRDLSNLLDNASFVLDSTKR